MKEYPACESPNHALACDGLGRTTDHFTPRCITKELGWSHQKTNSPENLQFLSRACHAEKDRSTPDRLEQVKWQKTGGMIYFGEHNIGGSIYFQKVDKIAV